jgi:LAO/AO transport system kinase
MQLLKKMLSGDVVALSQLITKIEEDTINTSEVVEEIYKHIGKSYCVGITGPPGIGKSTLIDGLITIMRRRDFSIGTILVDPTSPFSGGALLGDRIRLQKHNLDKDVFMRSMASRGKSGGLSKKVSAVIKLLDAFGKDFILVETVGVGQLEIDIVDIADTVVLVLAPHGGDIIQFIKAGIMEICDILVINKADLGGADQIIAYHESVLKRREMKDNWIPPVIETQALNNVGLEKVCDAIELHRQYLNKEGFLLKRRQRKIAKEFIELVSDELIGQLGKYFKHSKGFKTYLEKVESEKLNPYAVCKEMLSDPETWKELEVFLKKY